VKSASFNGRAALSWALFLSLETATQVVFKLAGAKMDASHGLLSVMTHAAVSPWAIGGFILYFGCFLLWMTILKDADLGRAFPMTALIYLCTLGAAIFLFHEVLSPLRLCGVVAIIAGVIVLVSDENSKIVPDSPVHG
jgi:drug/metabolite transporter (DMT)-like permease